MRTFRMPTAYTILFILLILVAAATWFVPAGAYERTGEDGTPVAGTYRQVERQPQGPEDVPYDRWVRFVWKLILIFFVLTIGFLAVSAIL